MAQGLSVCLQYPEAEFNPGTQENPGRGVCHSISTGSMVEDPGGLQVPGLQRVGPAESDSTVKLSFIPSVWSLENKDS